MEDYLIYAAGAGVVGLVFEKFFNDRKVTTQNGGGDADNIETMEGGDAHSSNSMDPQMALRNAGIDLTQINKDKIALNMTLEEPFELNSTKDKMRFFPMFYSLEKALEASPSNGVHLIVPGLLPAPDGLWKTGDPEKIYYMPNDSKPHHHGDAPHHLVEWDIDEVFEMNDMDWHEVEGKSIEKYRNKKEIIAFNKGENGTAVETWIDWRIPHDQKDYPYLVVKKYSIIWWDFFNTHNLGLVGTEDEFINNDFSNVKQVSKEDEKKSQTLVTIMNKRGTFYFVCSVKGHAQIGHKIIIKVI